MSGGMDCRTEKYKLSPLVAYDRGLETATQLLVLQVSPAVINFELRREHGFTEDQASVVIRAAAAGLPRTPRPPRTIHIG